MKPKPLKPEVKQAYIEKPNHCPYCQSMEIKSNDHTFENNIYLMYVECKCCGQTWTDVYRLVDMKPD